jgi:hypothetical protein
MESKPQTVTESELAQVPTGEPGSALNQYRSIYAMTRQKGLGRTPEDVEPTSEFAHHIALKAARSIDPSFDMPMPGGRTN